MLPSLLRTNDISVMSVKKYVPVVYTAYTIHKMYILILTLHIGMTSQGENE